MKYKLLFLITILSIVAGTLFFAKRTPANKALETPQKEAVQAAILTPTRSIAKSPEAFEIPHKKQVFQSFNNCGPAILAMALAYLDVDVSQETLGEKLRPYQIPNGDNDDKSVTFEEFAEEVKNYNLTAYHRPNGSVEKLQKLVSNGFPVLVRTWLHPNEDIGHYRLIRGFDNSTQEIIQDDSYEGPRLRYSYLTFSEMWKPFNYEYIVLTDKKREPLLRQILGEEVSEKKAWENALAKAKAEVPQEGEIPYSLFNQAVADYHLGNFDEAILLYEQIKRQLPPRMLWYQIEPIQALAQTNRFDQAHEEITAILFNNNLAFTELYVIQGEMYKKQGQLEEAKASYEQAVRFNIHNKQAQDALRQK